MSGPVGSQQWMYASGGFYPHEIGNSVRFHSNSQMSKTPSSAGDRKTWTWSAWFKRSLFSDSGYDGLFSAGTGGVNRDVLYFDNGDHLHWNGYTSSGYDFQYKTTQKFRDPAAWYHIVLTVDTTYAASGDRVKIFINGERITAYSTSTAASQNYDGYVNNNNEHTIGSTPYDSTYFDGYIAEVNFVDGTALDASYFGETKADTWVPKAYTGSYGTNGYYLDFATRATDPIDASGEGNNWGSVNVVATDWMPDSPTNNFAILNALSPGSWAGYNSYSEGGLQYATPVTGGGFGQGTIGIPSSDKWYFEVYVKTAGFSPVVGFCRSDCRNVFPSDADPSITYYSYGTAGYLLVNGSTDSGADAGKGAEDDDIVGVSYDGTDVKFYKNNSLMYTKTYDVSGLVPLVCDGTSGSTGTTGVINFGQDSSFAGNKTAQGNTDANGRGDFYYSPPAGHLALCTANLPDPPAAFNPALDNSPQDHFNTVVYTGNGSSISVTGVGFQPDMVWLKNRANAYDHELYDVLRGVQNYLMPNHTNGAATLSTTLTSFDSDGFSYGSNVGGNHASGQVAWNWKAGGSGVSNSDGTISATVSANTDAGFSIATYNGSGTGTVGHGLSSAPELVIIKSRSTSSTYWWTGTTVIDGSVDYLKLNDTDAKADSGYSAPTSSVFSNVTFSGSTDQVAYCFHSVEGFSKIGAYLDNGSSLGPVIYTGFRPAWVMVKRVNDTENWYINDTTRSTYNPLDSATLYANLSAAEGSGHAIDYLSNGFRIVNSNAAYNGSNTGSYLYIAFAEMPFKYANAR